MQADFDAPLALRVADFRLPEITELPAGLMTLENVILWPGVNGLHDAAGRPIPESCLRRGFALDHYPHGRPDPLNATSVRLAAGTVLERIVYLPYARMVHFGHLLTEFAAHVGPLLADPRGLDGIGGGHSLLVVSARCDSSIVSLANLLGVPSGRVLSTACLPVPVQVREAVIPRPSMFNRHGLSARHFGHVRHVLERVYGVGPQLAAISATAASDRLYLSRSRLPPGMRRVRDEEALEAELGRLGWRIIHPQELPVAEQLGRLAAAETVAGCLGSAMHLLMAFGERPSGRRLLALGSGAQQTNPNVALQAARQGLPFRHVVCLEADPESYGTDPPNQQLRFTVSPDRIARRLQMLAAEPLADFAS